MKKNFITAIFLMALLLLAMPVFGTAVTNKCGFLTYEVTYDKNLQELFSGKLPPGLLEYWSDDTTSLFVRVKAKIRKVPFLSHVSVLESQSDFICPKEFRNWMEPKVTMGKDGALHLSFVVDYETVFEDYLGDLFPYTDYLRFLYSDDKDVVATFILPPDNSKIFFEAREDSNDPINFFTVSGASQYEKNFLSFGLTGLFSHAELGKIKWSWERKSKGDYFALSSPQINLSGDELIKPNLSSEINFDKNFASLNFSFKKFRLFFSNYTNGKLAATAENINLKSLYRTVENDDYVSLQPQELLMDNFQLRANFKANEGTFSLILNMPKNQRRPRNISEFLLSSEAELKVKGVFKEYATFIDPVIEKSLEEEKDNGQDKEFFFVLISF